MRRGHEKSPQLGRPKLMVEKYSVLGWTLTMGHSQGSQLQALARRDLHAFRLERCQRTPCLGKTLCTPLA